MDDNRGGKVLHHTELTNLQLFVREEATLVTSRVGALACSLQLSLSICHIAFSFDSQLATPL